MRSKVLIVLVVVLVIAGLLWRRHEQQKTLPPPPPELVEARDQAVAPVKPEPPKVRRLAPEDRKKLGDDIHAALIRSVDKPPSLPSGSSQAPALSDGEPLLKLEDIGPNVKSVFEAAIPEFAKCYAGKTTAKVAAAQMVLVSDPDLGTVIDTPQMTDESGSALPKDIDDCLRDTADSLALPPLGKTGKLPIQYSFRFD